MTRYWPQTLRLFSLGLLLTLCLPASAQQTGRQDWRLSAILFPTRQFGVYDLCLDRFPAEAAFTVTPRLQEIRAEAQDAGSLKSFPAHLLLLPGPMPMKDYGPLTGDSSRPVWIGLRWDMHGVKPGLYRLRVSLPCNAEDAARQTVSFPAPTASLSVYLPRPDGLRAAQAKYLGRRVWMTQPLGLTSLTSHAGYQFAPQTSFRVKSMTRLDQPDADLAMNGGDGPGWDISNADFVTHDPLRVVFDQPRRVKITAHGWAGPVEPRFQMPLFQDFADPWQMERALHLSPPPVRTPKLRPGLTPAPVIAILGWPTEYGSLAQLKQRSTWRYDHLPPFSGTAYFSHGKFVRDDPGGHLP